MSDPSVQRAIYAGRYGNRAWSMFGGLRVEDPNQVVSLAANFAMADMYTLQFNALFPASKPASQLILPLAEV